MVQQRMFFLLSLGWTLGAASKESWPWTSLCQRRHDQECDVHHRGDLPSFEDNATYEAFLVSHPVQGSGSRAMKVTSFVFGLHHTAVALRKVGGPDEILLEFYALNFGPGIVVPTIHNGVLTWPDQAVIGWTPVVNNSEWPRQVSLGHVRGAVVNAFMDWIPTWLAAHGTYEVWSAWDGPELKSGMQRYYDETTCHTFTEAALTALYSFGAKLASKDVLCRNYVVLVSKGPLQPVESGARLLEMTLFYDGLGHLLNQSSDKTAASIRAWDALELVILSIAEKKQPFTFVHDGDHNANYYVELQRPFVELRPEHMSQRMILPWQTADTARLGECNRWPTYVSV